MRLDLGGYPVTLLDTAGIRDSNESVEQEGIRRARARAAAADLVLWVSDRSVAGRSEGDATRPIEAATIWLVENKIDLLPQSTKPQSAKPPELGRDEYKFISLISATEGEGVDSLVDRLADYAKEFFSGAEIGIVTRARHRQLLNATVVALDRALAEAAKVNAREELIAEELRAAATSLGRLTGRVDVEDILDVIFRDFCIGK